MPLRDRAHPLTEARRLELHERLESVRERIADAARAAGRDAAAIDLVVVTKFQPLEVVQELARLGVHDFGESRHPEARRKVEALPYAVWHFVGRVQTNKARQIGRYVNAIHSVDRTALIDALSQLPQAPELLLQVDLAGDEPGRGGVAPSRVPALAERMSEVGMAPVGVMTMAPERSEPRRIFAELRAVSEQLRRVVPGAKAISAGMSGDFEAAVLEGSTHLRVGTAVLGPRPSAP